MTKLADLKKKLMEDLEFKREYERLEPQFARLKARLMARPRVKRPQAQMVQKLKPSRPSYASSRRARYCCAAAVIKAGKAAILAKLNT